MLLKVFYLYMFIKLIMKTLRFVSFFKKISLSILTFDSDSFVFSCSVFVKVPCDVRIFSSKDNRSYHDHFSKVIFHSHYCYIGSPSSRLATRELPSLFTHVCMIIKIQCKKYYLSIPQRYGVYVNSTKHKM